MEQFFLVWCPTTGYTRFRHPDYNMALEEAKRLARLNKGSEFYVLANCAHAISDDVIVTELDQIPF